MKEHRKIKESDSFGVNSSLTLGQHIEAGSFTSPLTNAPKMNEGVRPLLLGVHGQRTSTAVSDIQDVVRGVRSPSG